MERNLVAGLFHAAASLGIAEAARRAARPAARRRRDARARMLVAENAIDLSALPRVLVAGRLAHRRAPRARPRRGTDEEIAALFAEAQAAKTFVNEAAARVVDRALALSGGAGYVNGRPLARAYRDVRPARSCTRSAPTAPTTSSATSRSGDRWTCAEMRTATVIIGAGQAGLALSHHLSAAGHDHVVLERGRVGERWRSASWDSLTLLTPNWLNALPGAPPIGDPGGFLRRAAFVAHLEAYAAGAPVRERTTVLRVGRAAAPATGW